jgi:AraC-type DNA-binding domain-containing proteins
MNDIYKQSYKSPITDNAEMAIYNCGLQRCEPGYSWGPGVRDHYLIHFIVSGKGTFQVDGKKYHLSEGQAFLIKPSQLVQYTADEHEPWEYYWVGFNGTNASRIVSRLPFSEVVPYYKLKNPHRIRETLYNIFLSRGHEVYHDSLMIGNLYIFLGELMREAKSLIPNKNSTGSTYVIKAIKFIQFNYSHDVRIDDIARSVGISRSHLYRVFINTAGCSPIDYLTEYRINEACYLLKSSNLSIAEVAASVGFFDQFYFSRVFRRAKGVPPSRFSSFEENEKNIETLKD